MKRHEKLQELLDSMTSYILSVKLLDEISLELKTLDKLKENDFVLYEKIYKELSEQ